MSTIARNTVFAIMIALVVGPARADQYWVAYEGNDFPENEGWERVFGDENGPQQGGSNRSIQDGWLVLDSTRNDLIYDSYFWRQRLNPDLGELFIAEWRLNVVQNSGVSADSGFTIARDGRGTLSFLIGIDSIRSSREQWTLPITPGTPHVFQLQSSNMLSYSLFIDGVFARTGVWDLDSLNESYVAFGDAVMGGGVTSYAEWDYVRFGVIPEPESAVLVGIAFAFLTSQRRARCSRTPVFHDSAPYF